MLFRSEEDQKINNEFMKNFEDPNAVIATPANELVENEVKEPEETHAPGRDAVK